MLLGLLAFAFPYFHAPAGFALAKVVPGGTTVLPNGRFLTPHGKRVYTGEDLWAEALSPDGRTLATESDDVITIITDLSSDKPTRKAFRVQGVAPALAFSKDSKTLYASLGDKGGVAVFDASSMQKTKTFPIPTEDGYISDLVVGEKGLFVADAVNGKVSLLDFDSGVAQTAAAGRQPYALRLSADQQSLYVANIGVFDYSPIPLPRDGEGNKTGISRPAFGFPSREAETGKDFEGRLVPGLGKTDAPDAQSVWKYDAATLKVTHKAKSGLLIQSPLPGEGGRAIGASAPNALAIHGGRLYVSNANNDTVSVFNQETLKPIATIDLTPIPAMRRLRGVIPSAMAISRDGSRLYVCESGLNAVAVIDAKAAKLLGTIPTGWFPNAIALSSDDKTLYVGTQKGLGRGPRGRLTPRSNTDERAGMPDMPGMVNIVDVPSAVVLKTWTYETLRNNGLIESTRPTKPSVVPNQPGKKSDQIETVVFIVKENHSFDGIFGDLPGHDGQPEYAEFGEQGWIREKGKDTRIDMMPNHHRLARQYAISDNFYMEPQASGDGHRWLVGVYPSIWTSRMFYAGWNFSAKSSAKGRLVSFGSNGSQIPEDYLENGSIWEHLQQGGVSFRNYGEGFEFPGVEEASDTGKSGAWEVANYPMPRALFDNTCFDFPIFNMSIPDIARVEWFKNDVAKYRAGHKGKIPKFLYIALCNDHGAGPSPATGYPYVSSWMADNDLALGRLVEYLTKQPEWKKMAIFVTQDDSGADDDHVDRHRSFVMAISPFAKRNYAGKEHTSIMSITRTIYSLFGLGPNNMFDAVATPLDELFTTKPNFTPYKSVRVDPRVFKPEATINPADPRFEKRKKMASPVRMDDPAFMEWLRNRKVGDR
ncbi:beta-propeller fold lactonase family protein [soil metagenome]